VRSTHAEAQALVRRRYYEGDRNLTLYVARRRADGSLGCSKPCANCLELCRVAGVRRVRYFDTMGKLKEGSTVNADEFSVVRTDEGFSMVVNGEMVPVPIGFMRVSEAPKLTAFVKQVLC
jgi:hypothetical protein